jgi:two-component system cell cycle response regulator DivK
MSKGSILYVEDNPDNRILIRRVLESEDYLVFEAENANEAINHLKHHKPDIILMDINMPEVDGYTLTSRIKAIPGFEQTPIIALTANVMRGDREKSIQAGCDGYIQKPIDIDTVTQQIERYIRKK